MLDARPHRRVDGSNVLRPALSGFRIDGRDDEQTIETRIGLRKAFGPVVVPESSLSRSRDGFGRACDSHYFVPAGTLQQFRNDGSAQMALAPLTPIFMSTSNTSLTNKLLLVGEFWFYRTTDASSKFIRGLRGWSLLGSP
jgi:hypothetical protein